MTPRTETEILAAIVAGTHQIRRITIQARNAECAMLVPTTDHWAGWHDADACSYHGREIATWSDGQPPRPVMGSLPRGWLDTGGRVVGADLAAAIASAPHAGIATK
jgi:hypothetical protein